MGVPLSDSCSILFLDVMQCHYLFDAFIGFFIVTPTAVHFFPFIVVLVLFIGVFKDFLEPDFLLELIAIHIAPHPFADAVHLAIDALLCRFFPWLIGASASLVIAFFCYESNAFHIVALAVTSRTPLCNIDVFSAMLQ